MRPLRPWMTFVLRFAACFNLLAGLSMLLFYHEQLKMIGVHKTPAMVLPIQLVGALVMLFGVGYWLVAEHPAENRHHLLLGFLSKLSGSLLAIYHVALGNLPPAFLGAVFFADIIYLPLFWVILRRLYPAA
ncbi:MAG: hypothetical protein K1X74_01695 [Pirellulales bacterium]|nr:hypothetical protein [Pirellulales bacterium]